ncbi:hypothetical protein [Paenibacillus planticolens]|uniref:Uncharacterized protein n=1 Tax=Paenibacillus planticolens TaxID=2654976 RepID=A0ABX1ZI99_9BACL|nr:hypothetical protein [Paenibacillus planticolens]NOU98551.1 hypothetical protein [Paenibacillus planticolens]
MRKTHNVTTFSIMVLCAILSLAGTDLVLPVVPQLPNLLSSDEATAQLVLAAYVGGSGSVDFTDFHYTR